MGDYKDGKKGPIIAPVPGRPIHLVQTPPSQNVHKEVDANAIASTVVQAVMNVLPGMVVAYGQGQIQIKENREAFQSGASMEKLADAMVVQRGESESNFENLGNIKETKKDSKETEKTIDLLKDLGD